MHVHTWYAEHASLRSANARQRNTFTFTAHRRELRSVGALQRPEKSKLLRSSAGMNTDVVGRHAAGCCALLTPPRPTLLASRHWCRATWRRTTTCRHNLRQVYCRATGKSPNEPQQNDEDKELQGRLRTAEAEAIRLRQELEEARKTGGTVAVRLFILLSA